MDQRTSDARGPLLAVFLTVFIDLLGFGIVIPLLPIYSKAHGASDLALGLLFASFSAMQLVFAPLWGRISDRMGRRRVLLIGLAGTSCSYLLFGLADSMTMLFVSRMLAGFFGANVPIAQAYIADVTPPEERAKGMGIIGAAFGLGFTLGPLVGGELVGVHHGAPGFAAAALSLCACILGFFRLVEPHTHAPDRDRRIFGFETVGETLRDVRIGWIVALYFLAILSFSGFETMFIRFGLARFPTVFGLDGALADASLDQIYAAAPIAGRYMFFIGLVAALVQGGLIRRLVPRLGETRLIVLGPALLGTAMLFIGLAHAWWVVLGACALMPFGFGVNNPSLNGLLSRAAPVQRQGAFLGLNQSMGSLARVLGPALAGFAFEHWGAGSPFFIAAGLLALATVLALTHHRRFAAQFRPGRAEEAPLSQASSTG
jgi:MFS family permease